MSKTKVYTEKQLNSLCKEYQRILRIQDWNIRVSLVTEGEIDGAQGCHNSDLGLMSSHIHICSEESFTPRHATPELNMSQVLLHELVHIVFSTLGPDDKDEVKHNLWESGIDRIAYALDNLISGSPFHTGDDPDNPGTEGEDSEKNPKTRECPECKKMLPPEAYFYPDGKGYWKEGATMCIACAKAIEEAEKEKVFRCNVCGRKHAKEDMKYDVMNRGVPETDHRYNLCQSCFDDRGELYKEHAQTVSFQCKHCRYVNSHYLMEKVEGEWQCKEPYGTCWENTGIGEPCDKTEFYKIRPEQAHFYSTRYQCHSCELWHEGLDMETYFHHNNPTQEQDSHLNLCKTCNEKIGNEDEPKLSDKEIAEKI